MSAKHIVFATTGSLGDLHPFLALGCELQARGYKVTIATTKAYAPNVAAAGLKFCYMRPDPEPSAQFHAAYMHPLTGGQFVYADYLAPAIRESYADLLEASKDADLLVSQTLMALATPLVVERTGIRWISAVFQPMSFFSVHDRPSYLPSSNLPSRLLQWLCAISPSVHRKVLHYVKIHTRAWVSPVFALRQELNLTAQTGGLKTSSNDVRLQCDASLGVNKSSRDFLDASTLSFTQRKLGTRLDSHSKQAAAQIKSSAVLDHLNAQQHPMFDAQHSPYCVLAMFSPLFGSPQPDWPAQTKQTGQAIYAPKVNDISADLRAFLQEKPPLIFTLSSAASNDAGDFYNECFKAAQALAMPALLMTGGLAKNVDLPNPLPALIKRIDYADFAITFPYAAIIVHAGGISTSFHALMAGKLQIVVPHAHDQTDNALRLQKLGVAQVIRRAQFNSASLQKTLRALLKNALMRQRARDLALIAKAENGVKAACDIIESALHDA